MKIDYPRQEIEGLKTDYHCHILPGIDDGPATLDESIAMARALIDSGYQVVCCTPHLIKGRFEADNATVLQLLDTLKAELRWQNLELHLLPGREYYLDEYLLGYLADPLTLGDTRRILIEIPHNTPVEFVKETCYRITCRGYTPVIAHPERCTHFHDAVKKKKSGSVSRLFNNLLQRKSRQEVREECSLLEYLCELGCEFQGNLASFSGRYGEQVRTCGQYLHKAGIYTFFGTDGHSFKGIKSLRN